MLLSWVPPCSDMGGCLATGHFQRGHLESLVLEDSMCLDTDTAHGAAASRSAQRSAAAQAGGPGPWLSRGARARRGLCRPGEFTQ